MQHYELLYIISAKFSEEELEPIIKKINQLITGQGGKITIEDNLGRKKLAYEIKHQYHGYYILNEFDFGPESLKKLGGQLKLTEEILRHQIIVKKVKTPEELEKEKNLKEKILRKREEKIAETREVKEAPAKLEKKVSMEELDKKINEILDTDII